MPSPPDPRPQRPGLSQIGEVVVGNMAAWDSNGRLNDAGVSASSLIAQSTFDQEGIMPASQTPAGFAITSNYAGFGEVDFWNLVNNEDTDQQGFYFNQKTGESTSKNLAALFSTSTFTELDINGAGGVVAFSVYVDNSVAAITSVGGKPIDVYTGAAGTTLVATFGATGGFTLAVGAFGIPTSTPASAAAAGVAGTIAWDASFIYICTATNTWKRVAIATW